MISQLHPYWHVRSVIERRSDVLAVPVSYYTYQPRTVEDSRTTWLIPTEDFLDPLHMFQLMEATPAGQELAVHSDVRLRNKEHAHLVMVDMSTSAKAHIEKLRAFIGDNFFHKIAWYESGRSFHGYGETLLSEAEWVKFMGLLLLVNQPKLEPTVDPRWIGHRLLAGYASLRWTKNTQHYLGVPTSIDKTVRGHGASLEVSPLGKMLGAAHIKGELHKS